MIKIETREKADRRVKYYKICKLAIANNNNRIGMD